MVLSVCRHADGRDSGPSSTLMPSHPWPCDGVWEWGGEEILSWEGSGASCFCGECGGNDGEGKAVDFLPEVFNFRKVEMSPGVRAATGKNIGICRDQFMIYWRIAVVNAVFYVFGHSGGCIILPDIQPSCPDEDDLTLRYHISVSYCRSQKGGDAGPPPQFCMGEYVNLIVITVITIKYDWSRTKNFYLSNYYLAINRRGCRSYCVGRRYIDICLS